METAEKAWERTTRVMDGLSCVFLISEDHDRAFSMKVLPEIVYTRDVLTYNLPGICSFYRRVEEGSARIHPGIPGDLEAMVCVLARLGTVSRLAAMNEFPLRSPLFLDGQRRLVLPVTRMPEEMCLAMFGTSCPRPSLLLMECDEAVHSTPTPDGLQFHLSNGHVNGFRRQPIPQRPMERTGWDWMAPGHVRHG
ncbi:MAG: hypothetical protein F4213_11840 [Boseongicola sp. SB0677_bin_26]|nr:hypothetical protein [Boseongicola sp. SB0677_bin_26]